MGKFTLPEATSLLKTNPPSAKDTFATLARTIRKKSRIHAEVQLLVHCDRYLHGLKPRVICSNKEACFLCDLVIKTHGKFYTPYSHGRLYPGWRLPKVSGDQLARQFNIALRERAQASLGQMKRERKAIGYKHPDESASHTLVISSTSLAEAEPGDEAREGGPSDTGEHFDARTKQKFDTAENENGGHTKVEAGSQSTRAERSHSVHERDTAPAEITTSTREVEGMLTADIGPKPPVEGIVNATSIGGKRSGHILRRGETVSTPLETCSDNSQMFVANNFDLVIDRATGSASSPGVQHPPKPFTCTLSWAPDEEACHIAKENGSSIVDTGTLNEVTLPLDGFTTFFLRDDDGSMLRVSLNPGVPARSRSKVSVIEK